MARKAAAAIAGAEQQRPGGGCPPQGRQRSRADRRQGARLRSRRRPARHRCGNRRRAAPGGGTDPPLPEGARADPAGLAADPSGTERGSYRMQDRLVWPVIAAVLVAIAVVVAIVFVGNSGARPARDHLLRGRESGRRRRAEAGEQFGFPGLGALQVRLLDMAEAADLERQSRQFDGGFVVLRRQGALDFVEQRLRIRRSGDARRGARRYGRKYRTRCRAAGAAARARGTRRASTGRRPASCRCPVAGSRSASSGGARWKRNS